MKIFKYEHLILEPPFVVLQMNKQLLLQHQLKKVAPMHQKVMSIHCPVIPATNNKH